MDMRSGKFTHIAWQNFNIWILDLVRHWKFGIGILHKPLNIVLSLLYGIFGNVASHDIPVSHSQSLRQNSATAAKRV